MPDPLSIAAAVGGLCELTQAVAVTIYEFLKTVKEAKSEIEDLIREVTGLFGVLHSLHLVAARFEGQEIDSAMQVHHIVTCQVLLGKIQRALNKAQPKSSLGALTSAAKSLAWPFEKKETKALILDVERHKSTLSLALIADGINALLLALGRQEEMIATQSLIHHEVKLLTENAETAKLRKERSRILDAWTTLDPKYQQSTAFQLRHPHTGIWFTDGDDFKAWMDGEERHLWLSGIPGAGKTILTSTIIHTLSNRISKNSEEKLAYFYCDYKQSSTHEPGNILRSLIKQIGLRSEESFTILKDFWKARGGSKDNPELALSPAELKQLLRSMAMPINKLFLVIDALDECIDTRSEVLDALKNLHISKEENIRVLYTSRNEIDIQQALTTFTEVKIEAQSVDLELYVASEIQARSQSGQLRIKDPLLKAEIMERLVNEAQGMFRWAACQLDFLCQVSSDKARREALGKLPPTLFGTYQRILDRVNDSHIEQVKSLVERSLRWIVNAEQNESGSDLSTDALLEAISISPGDICRDESAMPDEHDILRWCSSLVRKAVDGKSIEIAHFTVKEFLKAIDPAETPTLSRYKYSKPHSLAEMAKTSLTYLSFSDFNVAAPADFLRVTRYPFWEYVAERWDFYYRESTEDSELFKLTLEFFDISVKPEFITWTRYIAWRRDLWKLGTNKLLNPEDPISIADIKQIMKSGGKATVLHWAALLGLRDLCDSLIPKCDVNRDSELGYPLHCVISGGKDSLTPDVKHIAEGMLQNGANLNVRSSWVDDLSPLAFAIQEEHPDLIELLLGAGALVDAESIDEVRTLMTRRRGDNDLIPSRFFDSVQEKNIPEHIRPLMVLTGNFRESTTRQAMNFLGTGRLALLEDLHIYEYGIREAVQYGRTDTLNRLLEYDISLLDKADDDDGKTALHFASENSHLEALEILLSCGANINAVDKDGNTTLHFAISSGENLEAIPILVKFNPDILLQNKEGDNCLHLAARSKHTEYMSSLLNIDAREEGRLARNHEGKTPLLCAIESEISSEMMLLVAESLSPDHFLVRTELQETGLHLSAKRLNIPAMKLFLAKGALNEKDEEGNTALHVIFHAEEMIGQLLDAVRLLIGHGADASISNNQGRLPLHEVIEGIDAWASLKCLKLLAAAKGGSQWCNSETESDVAPLHHLISLEMDKNRLAMFRYLCEDMHANIEVQNEKGQTALLHLTRRAPDGNYRNHPHWSQAMTILLELGANIHSADCDGCTAAHYLCLSSSFSNDLEKLLERGLSTIHRNHAKKAPFDLILEKLEEYEKDKADRRRQNMFDSLNLLISNTTTNDFQTYEQTSGRERMIVLALRSNQASLVSLLANKTLDVDDSYSLDPNILTPLEAACSFSCSTTIFQLLANQCSNLSRQTKQGNTLLMKAVSHGQVEQLKILVFKGVDVNIRNFNGFTALHRAVTRRKLDIMTVLLEAGASTSNRLSRGYSIWHTAVTRDDDDVLKLLCERNDKSGLEDRLADGQTPLLLAISSARIQTVRRLLALGADCRAVDNKGLNALHYAALQQQVEIIELVLGQMKRPNLGAPTSEGATALSLAASKGFVASFWQLLEHGSKSIVRYNDLRSLLHVVAASGEVSMVEMLLAKNQLGDVNAQDKKGWTPLFYAVENGHHVMADTLLNHGADINSLAKDDTDLVDLIAQGGHNHVLVTLLPRGLKLRTRTFTSQKHPPLVTAAIAGHVPVISTLLGAGALLSQVDEQGRNMLHYIAGETFEGAALIAILQYVKAHATEAVLDLEAKDTSGKRALDIAVENNNDEIAYILKASFDELDWL